MVFLKFNSYGCVSRKAFQILESWVKLSRLEYVLNVSVVLSFMAAYIGEHDGMRILCNALISVNFLKRKLHVMLLVCWTTDALSSVDSDCSNSNIFSGEGCAFGHYYMRPHETFHEASRRFFPCEVFRAPLYHVVPLDAIMGTCCVMDLATYCKVSCWSVFFERRQEMRLKMFWNSCSYCFLMLFFLFFSLLAVFCFLSSRNYFVLALGVCRVGQKALLLKTFTSANAEWTRQRICFQRSWDPVFRSTQTPTALITTKRGLNRNAHSR